MRYRDIQPYRIEPTHTLQHFPYRIYLEWLRHPLDTPFLKGPDTSI